MARNRYAQDYRLLETVDDRGRVKRSAVYIGGAYRFCLPASAVRKGARVLLFGAVLGWLGAVTAFLFRTPFTRSLTCALPLAFAFLPLALLVKTGVALLLVKEPMKHAQADGFSNHIPPIGLFLMALPAVSVAFGIRVAVKEGGISLRDGTFFAGALMIALCGFTVFRRRHNFQTASEDTGSKTEKEEVQL